MSTPFDEAMAELKIADDATPDEKMRACTQWFLGDPEWWPMIQGWIKEAAAPAKIWGDDPPGS